MKLEQFKNSLFKKASRDHKTEEQLNYYFRKLGIYVQVDSFRTTHDNICYVFINGEREKALIYFVNIAISFLNGSIYYNNVRTQAALNIIRASYKLGLQ